MRPYLLLSTRPEDEAAHGEHEAVARFAGLDRDQLHQVRVEAAPLPALDLAEYSGIILGGGPFNSSDPDKSELQLRVEADLRRLLDDVLARDLPFLGLCYGVGTVTTQLGGVVDRRFGEPVSAVDIRLTDAGRRDPLLTELAALPGPFTAFVGHKEAVSQLPDGAVLLASGDACPVQMFRVGANCYVTQFHPELDGPGIGLRIHVYQHTGYFRPEETQSLLATTSAATITPQVHSILRRFVRRYAR
ncbi:glutamine amidotransferase [Tessaracoccus terricola]